VGVAILGILIGIVAGLFMFKDRTSDLPISFTFRKDTGHGDKVKIIDES